MSKAILVSLLAVCGLAAPQTLIHDQQPMNDAPGVTVQLNGATLLHRTRVNYPASTIQAGIQGTVSVEVQLDSTGMVEDARVLSGPEELRKPALSSILEWHFTREMAGATHVIQIAFEAPTTVTAPSTQPPPNNIIEGTVRSIRVVGLSDPATAQLLASLPIHEGDSWSAESFAKLQQASHAFDEHLSVRISSMMVGSSGREINLTISAPDPYAMVAQQPAVAGRISVSGSAQGAQIVKKVMPEYPPIAKSARVSGVVRLSAVIGKDGTVKQLTALDGPALLQQAAIEAVRQWVYQPTMVNGQAVEVETTIEVNFALSQ